MPTEQQAETRRPHVGQAVIWLQQRKWGGKQNVPATYIFGVGRNSARIQLSDKTEKTVRLASLRWDAVRNENHK